MPFVESNYFCRNFTIVMQLNGNYLSSLEIKIAADNSRLRSGKYCCATTSARSFDFL